jgi:hypothetical protein
MESLRRLWKKPTERGFGFNEIQLHQDLWGQWTLTCGVSAARRSGKTIVLPTVPTGTPWPKRNKSAGGGYNTVYTRFSCVGLTGRNRT